MNNEKCMEAKLNDLKKKGVKFKVLKNKEYTEGYCKMMTKGVEWEFDSVRTFFAPGAPLGMFYQDR